MGRFDLLDPSALGMRSLPDEGQLAARAQLDLDRIAEPAADVLGLGDDRPDDLDGRLDQDLALNALRNQRSDLLRRNEWLRYVILK